MLGILTVKSFCHLNKIMANVFYLAFLFPLIMSSSSENPCDNDSDCKDESYCSSKTHFCENCIPCSIIFNRQPPSSNETCAKTEKDCGNCLPGYLADESTNERNFSTKCYAPEKLVSHSSNPNAPETQSILAIFIASASVAFVVAIILFAVSYKKSRQKKPPLHCSTGQLEMVDVKRPQPSAPLADFDVEETTESNEEMRRLMNPYPTSTVQVDRLCGALPVGPHHEYHPPVDDATKAAVSSSIPEISPQTNTPALDMPPRLFRQNSGYDSVRPPLLRSFSDSSGKFHIRLSHYRPAIIRSIDSSDQECGTQDNVPDHSQLQPVENGLEVGAALTIKRSTTQVNRNPDTLPQNPKCT